MIDCLPDSRLAAKRPRLEKDSAGSTSRVVPRQFARMRAVIDCLAANQVDSQYTLATP